MGLSFGSLIFLFYICIQSLKQTKMGAYIFTVKQSKTKKALLDGVQVSVDIATFLCRDTYDWDTLYGPHKAAITKADNIAKEDQADYIVFYNFDGADIYKNNKLGSWSDRSGWYSGLKEDELVGKLFKIGNKYHIVPKEIGVLDYMKINFLDKISNPLATGQVHTGINEHYTATVRCVQDYENYVFGMGKNQTTMRGLNPDGVDNASESVPEWFKACVVAISRTRFLQLKAEKELEDELV